MCFQYKHLVRIMFDYKHKEKHIPLIFPDGLKSFVHSVHKHCSHRFTICQIVHMSLSNQTV